MPSTADGRHARTCEDRNLPMKNCGGDVKRRQNTRRSRPYMTRGRTLWPRSSTVCGNWFLRRLFQSLSRQTGESEVGISKGLSAAIPAITSTVAGRADDQGFVRTFRISPQRLLQDLIPSRRSARSLPRQRASIRQVRSGDGCPACLVTTSLTSPTAWLGMRGSAEHRPHGSSQSPRRSSWDTSGAWCEATISASPVLPTCSGDNAPNSRRPCQPASRCRKCSARPTRGLGRPGDGAHRLVGSAHGAAGRTLYRWTDLVGSPEARRSGSRGHLKLNRCRRPSARQGRSREVCENAAWERDHHHPGDGKR